MKPELQGHRPLAKFLTIKIIVALVFYQSFMFSVLGSYGLLHETRYWSSDNIAEGLNFFVTTIEMVLIALFQIYAFPVSEYRVVKLEDPSAPRVAVGPTSFWRSFFHSQNYSDFLVDAWLSLRWYFDSARGKSCIRREKEYCADRKALGGNDLDLHAAFFGGLPDGPLPRHATEKDLSGMADRNALAASKAAARGHTSSRRNSVDSQGGGDLGTRILPTLSYRGRTPSVDFGAESEIDVVIENCKVAEDDKDKK